jgi:hypothetical protein
MRPPPCTRLKDDLEAGQWKAVEVLDKGRFRDPIKQLLQSRIAVELELWPRVHS